MNISRFFILRPVATTLLMVAIVLTGWVAWRFLPVSALPEVDYPTMQVVTLYPGASPEVTASSVTAPLERQFGQMSGLAQMSSSSSGGASVITLQFGLDIRLDVAEQEVQAAINAANSVLPSDLPSPPIYNKVNPADLPILTIAVTSSSLPLHKLEDWVDTRLAQKISQVSGVGLVSLGGGQRPAVRVQVNAQALASRGLTLQDIRTSIASANVNQAKGSFDGPQQASTLDGNDQLKSADEYRQLVLAYVSGAPVRLGDVARVVDAAENNRLAAWANTQPAIVLNVQRQPRANVIEVADRIQALLPELKDALPNAVSVVVLSDRTDGIRASVKAVQVELMLAIALVVAVIFVFLRNLSSTVIPAVAVPLSLVGTLGVMYLLGFSINNLTLMALTIATGFVVDDAIVMIENIARYLEQGDSPMNAALKGAGEIGFTIISLTVSLIAVLIPLLFMEDLVGRLFREFALTLAVSILISAGVSLTLTPMMCARFLRHTPEHQQGRFYQGVGRFFDRLIAHYGRMLSWVLNRQTQTLGVALGTLIFTGVLYMLIPKGFFPLQDTNAIQAITEASQSISFSAVSAKQQALAELLLQDPAVDSIASSIGVDGSNATLNTGRMQINLKPKAQRDDVRTVMARLKQRAAEVEGVSLYVQAQQDLTVDSTVSRTQYQFTLQSPNMSDLTQWVPVLMEHLKTLPELSDVTSDLQTQGLQAYVTINRDTASRLGVSTANIGNALYDAFGQRLVSTIFTQTNQYKVVLEVDRTQQDGLPSLRGIYVPSSAGKPVPLESVASVSQRYAPLAIHRLGQFPVVRVSFNLAEGAALGQAVKAIQDTQQSLQMPRQISTQFQGAAVAFQASLSNTLWLMLAAIVTMYIVLGVLYESYIHPVTILSTLPSAGIGALLALQMTGHDLNVIAVIGIVLLIGIVKKNAIMMIDFALQAEREQGMAPRDAIFQACLLRFRPILMTTFAALFGALPLMLGQGMGSELRQPLGVALVGGLLLSQVLTLFTTPVIYLVFDRFSRKSSREGQPA